MMTTTRVTTRGHKKYPVSWVASGMKTGISWGGNASKGPYMAGHRVLRVVVRRTYPVVARILWALSRSMTCQSHVLGRRWARSEWNAAFRAWCCQLKS